MIIINPHKKRRDIVLTTLHVCMCQSYVLSVWSHISQSIVCLIQTWNICKVQYVNVAWQVSDKLVEEWLNYVPLFIPNNGLFVFLELFFLKYLEFHFQTWNSGSWICKCGLACSRQINERMGGLWSFNFSK